MEQTQPNPILGVCAPLMASVPDSQLQLTETVLLVDCENIWRFEALAVPADLSLVAFIGARQKQIRLPIKDMWRMLAQRFACIECQNGKNSLDFHLVYYLGRFISASPKSRYVILSSDRGFDAVATHLRQCDYQVRRVETQAEAYPEEWRQAEELTAQIGTQLKEMQPSHRPVHQVALWEWIVKYCDQPLATPQISNLMDRLHEVGLVSSYRGMLTYHC